MSGSQGGPGNTVPVLAPPGLLSASASASGGPPFGTWLFGNTAIGKDTSGNLAFALEGVHNIAARRRGETPENDTFWVARNEGGEKEFGLRLVDVTPIVRPTSDFIIRVPVRAENVKPGDVIIQSDNPFQVLFVNHITKDGTIVGLDLYSRIVPYVPPRNLLLHNTQLLVKAISVFDFFRRRHEGHAGEDDDIPSDLLAFLPLLASGTPAGAGGGTSGGGGQGTIDLNTLLLLQAAREDDGDIGFEEFLPLLLAGNQTGDWFKLIPLLTLLRRRRRKHQD
jgi:hypothetical protein